MKISKVLDPIISGLSAAFVIGILAFLTLRTSSGIWIMFSFGATVFIVFALHSLDTAQPKNVFFGHLCTALVGVVIVNFVPLPIYINIAIGVGLGVFFMILLNIVHPPAGGNPIMVIIGSASYEYLINPIIFGCIIILLLAILVNKFILKKNYPSK